MKILNPVYKTKAITTDACTIVGCILIAGAVNFYGNSNKISNSIKLEEFKLRKKQNTKLFAAPWQFNNNNNSKLKDWVKKKFFLLLLLCFVGNLRKSVRSNYK